MSTPTDFLSPGDAKRPLFAGFDVGGTSIKLGIADSQGRSLGFHRIPTEPRQGADQAARRMGDALRELSARLGLGDGDVVRVGLATPGTMDIPAGRLLTPGNLPGWHGAPIRDWTSEACGLPVTFANDANAAAYGEFWCGAGLAARSMVMFTLGTGVGGGIIDDGRLIEGMHSSGGELGHIVIDGRDDAPLNTLGLRGTLEGFCGAYGVVRRAEAQLAAGDASSLRKRLAEGAELTPLLIAEEAERGDQLALDIVLDTARYLAMGAATVIHAVDPESVVIGGAMTFGGPGHPLGERFMDHLRSKTRERIFTHLRDKVRIDFATLGSDAGYLGAAGLACREQGVRQSS